MSVNFTTVDTFKYWCNKILPLVYDDSLSYYEQLCKVVAVLNQVVENVNKLPEYIAELVSDERLKEILTELLAEIKEQVASGNEGDSETATSDRVVGELVWLKGKLYRVIKQMDNGDRYVVDGNVEKVTVESVIDDLKGDVAEYVEVNQSIAGKDIKEGELVWYKNELVKCIKDITQGSGYVEGSNYEVVTVEKLLSDLGLRVDNEAEARKNADNTLQGGIYAEANNRESADNQLQSNIDAEKADRESADNQLQSALDTEKSVRESADNQLQSALDTEKSVRESADNQLQSRITLLESGINIRNKKILIIGDSNSDASVVSRNWAIQFKERAEASGATVDVDGRNGATIIKSSIPSVTERFNETSKDYDIILVELGVNDCLAQESLYDIDTEMRLFNDTLDQINTPPVVYWIMPFKTNDSRISGYPLDTYRAVYKGLCDILGFRTIDGTSAPVVSLTNTDKYYKNDGLNIHPNDLASKYICDFIYAKVLSGGDSQISILRSSYRLSSLVSGLDVSVDFQTDFYGLLVITGGFIPTQTEIPIVALSPSVPLTYMANSILGNVLFYDTDDNVTFGYVIKKTDNIILQVQSSSLNKGQHVENVIPIQLNPYLNLVGQAH